MAIDSGYFGMKVGEALTSGAGHISEALQRKYAMQKRQEEIDKQEVERKRIMDIQNKHNAFQTNMQLGSMGVDVQAHPYDPMNPEASLQYMQPYFTKKQEAAALAGAKTQAEIDRINRESEMGGTKPPAGYRPTAQGNLEMIPGGPADLKAQAEMTKTKESQATQDERIANTKMRVDKAIERLGFFTTGLGADTLSKIGGTDARSLKGDLDTIKANLGFDRLTQMRNESKTGGALGNVSDRELTLLTAAAASLDQGMKKKDLEANLLQIKEILDKAKSFPDGMSATADNGMIRVMNKQTGKTGSMPKANFDPSKYDQI